MSYICISVSIYIDNIRACVYAYYMLQRLAFREVKILKQREGSLGIWFKLKTVKTYFTRVCLQTFRKVKCIFPTVFQL